MTLDYQKVWNTLNELESVSSKICSAREILDSALDALENHKKDKAEALMYAADEYLKYYLQEFDSKFKDAWNETVMKVKVQEYNIDPAGNYVNTPWSYNDEDVISFNVSDTINNNLEDYYYPDEYKGSTVSSVSDNMPPWGHSDMEALSQQKEDKVIKWRLPVEEVEDGDTGETEYFITFPDDLLEAANLNPGDEVEWHDRGDGSFILKKLPKTYDKMIADGWTMTADGFWIKE